MFEKDLPEITDIPDSDCSSRLEREVLAVDGAPSRAPIRFLELRLPTPECTDPAREVPAREEPLLSA